MFCRFAGTGWEWKEAEDSGEIPVPVPVLDESRNKLFNIAAVSAGTDHSLAILRDGTVYTWGENFYGQLGDRTRKSRGLCCVDLQQHGVFNIVRITAKDGCSDLEDAAGGRWAWGKSDEWKDGSLPTIYDR